MGDKRLGKRAAILLAFMLIRMRVVMQKSDTWKEQISYYRFFNNQKVSEQVLTECAWQHCAQACKGMEEVLLIQDTTELNLEAHRKRIRDKEGLGETGNGTDLGFFCHLTIAVNPCDWGLMGLADISLMARTREKDAQGKYKKRSKHCGRTVEIQDKESYRWIERSIVAKGRFGGVGRVTVVQDREGDIYESFYHLRQAGVDFVIRSNYDRRVRAEEAQGQKLVEHLEQQDVAYEYSIEVVGESRGRKKRQARVEVKYGKVQVQRPERIGGGAEKYPGEQELYVVQAREKPQTLPAGEEGIEWRLYTSHKVESREEAEKIIRYYQKRWIIEDVFRTLKSEGVNYEASELESGKGLRKLLVMALMVVVQILQLRQARGGQSEQKTSLIFSEEQVECLEELVRKFEGKTEKQKNRWEKNNLAWASWIIGRLGGWKGYESQRPPGVITLHEGLRRFHDIYQGWLVAKDVYKR
jgi:hypothetical protein